MLDKELIQLHIIAEDFHKRGGFADCCNCLIATAAKRQFKTDDVTEEPRSIQINENYYTHEYFGMDKYYEVIKDSQPFTLILTLQ